MDIDLALMNTVYWFLADPVASKAIRTGIIEYSKSFIIDEIRI